MLGNVLPSWETVVRRLDRTEWQGNDVLEWSYALAAFVLSWIVLRAVHALVNVRLRKVAERSKMRADDVLADVVAQTRWFFHATVALLIARQFIEVPKPAVPWVNGVQVVALFVQGGLWVRQAGLGGTRYWVQKEGVAHTATVASGINFVLNLVVWIVVGLLVLTNLGIEVDAVVAGLGVGGIAAALALQSILSDVFAGLSMYFDRPFDIGDFIVLDPQMGTVTRIGIRTTRLRSLEGDELVVPNGDLVKTRIKNFARLSERRIQFGFSIEYGHSVEQIREAQRIAAEVVQACDRVRFDRAHFKSFSRAGLDFEVAYFVLASDYNLFMDVQQEINLALYERFERAGIRFAFDALQLQRRDEPDEPTSGDGQRETGGKQAAA